MTWLTRYHFLLGGNKTSAAGYEYKGGAVQKRLFQFTVSYATNRDGDVKVWGNSPHSGMELIGWRGARMGMMLAARRKRRVLFDEVLQNKRRRNFNNKNMVVFRLVVKGYSPDTHITSPNMQDHHRFESCWQKQLRSS